MDDPVIIKLAKKVFLILFFLIFAQTKKKKSTTVTQPRFSSGGPSKRGKVFRCSSVPLRHAHLVDGSFVPLPKSATPSRIHANANLYDFELTEGDIGELDALDKGKEGAISWNPVDAD